ncbi:hypothetical protein VP01_2742g4 [Puccinia sorghi]|uniref:Uncharacterized protein n=1 Tax=Puccinia sorghi TaxID=27349 RepID=A0A0L6V334_9BASI|nr:hypothetical protein VP01_2742g4 [Puccinia sorghi]
MASLTTLDLFQEITGLQQDTFNILIAELREAKLLGDGQLVTQVQLVYAMCCLCNFMRKNKSIGNMSGDSSFETTAMDFYTMAQEDSYMKHRRERLAKKLWKQYLTYTGQQTNFSLSCS